MSVALETVVKQLEDSGIVAAGKLENFIPPKAHPKSVEELVAQLVKGNHLTKFQAAQVAAGKSRSLILGEYTILNKIGAGGMGQVFKALHRRMDRFVAIKMLPPAMTKDAAAIARFEREVRAAAKLRHPNIVAADDAGQANGVHFLVMEYVDGQDLSQLVKKNGPFPVAKAVNYALQAARGLEFAHSEGVVHRDIKPANLLLDKKGTVKILDMGLARIESQGNGAAQAELTGTGAIMGTVDYMAPEQGMSTKHADARADIYSLGCSLYYLIAGKATYDGETMAAKLVAHHTHAIPDLRSVQADITDDLEAVFKKMVAKRLEDRYQSMTEVIADLDRLGRSSGTVNDPYAATAAIRSGAMAARKGNDVSPSGGKQPPWKSTKVLIGAGAAGFLFLLLGVWVIIRDKDGNEVARVQVPEGGTATVQTPAPPKTADTPKTTVPATPTVPPPAPTTTATTAPAAVPPPQPTSKTAGNQPTVASPLADYALEFDGTDNYVDIPSLQLVKGEPRTVEFWISNCGPSPRHRLFDMLGDGASLALDFVPHPAPSDQASWTVFGKTSTHPNTGFYSATQPIPGAPQHIAVTFDNQSVHPTLFMNGKRLDGPKKGFGFKLPSSMGTVLGGHRGDDGKFVEFFNGRMHQVRVSHTVRYSREFTPAKRFEPDADTLALYHFDEGAGDVLKDSSGNGHHGKIVGAK